MINKIIKYLPWAERVFLIFLVAGAILIYFEVNTQLLQLSVLALAIIFFLSAFKIIDIPRKEDEQFGFLDLLAFTIAPKVLWIGSAVSLFGFFIYLLQLGHSGHERGLMSGALGIISGLLIIGVAFISGTKHLKFIVPILLRAIPVAIVDLYLLF
ncbi:MAG: hypothetical protein J0L67_14295 [Cytophagales bacterium]|nr:hypothetical protein [Cytophagales bacterium]